MRSDREYRLELESLPTHAGRVANASKPFRRDTTVRQPSRLERLTDSFSPDFYAFLGTAIAVLCIVGLVVVTLL